jgi:hypothetical protein
MFSRFIADLKIAKLAQSFLNQSLFRLIGACRFVARQITQDKRQQLLQATEHPTELLLGSGAQVFWDLHVPHLRHFSFLREQKCIGSRHWSPQNEAQ